MIYTPSFDNQKESKNSFQATTFKVEENSRTCTLRNLRTFQDRVSPALPIKCYPTMEKKTFLFLI